MLYGSYHLQALLSALLENWYIQLLIIAINCHFLNADPSGFILFPLVVHSFDLVISSVGIFSIRGTRSSNLTAGAEDPMTILQKGYSLTILLAVLTFGVVIIFNFQLLVSNIIGEDIL